MDAPASLDPVSATILYRPLTVHDLAAARELWSTADGVELAEGDDPEQLVGYLHRNPGISQGAWAGSRLVGAVLAGHDGRRGWLYHLAVARDQRGNGIGGELVERSLQALKREGIVRSLILVANDNTAGAAFWQRGGWDALEAAHARGIDL